LRIFRAVEGGVSSRVELFCEETRVEVVDVAVLVIAPAAHEGVFGEKPERGTAVILGQRNRIYAFLHAGVPPLPDAPFDPYVDLLEAAPARCVRVLIIDDESLTVLSYGSFVTVDLDPDRLAVA